MDKLQSVIERYQHPTAERITVAGLLKDDKQSIAILEELEPTDYHQPLYRCVFGAAKRILLSAEPMDLATLATECRNINREWRLGVAISPDFLTELRNEDVSRAPQYTHVVARFSWLRRFAEMNAWASDELERLPDPVEFFAAANERIQQLKPKQPTSRFLEGADTIKFHEDTLRQREAERKDGSQKLFRWPWLSWNACVRALRPTLLGVLSAPDGMGKSAILENIAEHWARQFKVVYVTFENDFENMLDRRAARWSGLPLSVIEEENFTPEQWRLYRAGQTRINEFAANLTYYDASGCTIQELVNELSERVANGLCDAVTMDYFGKQDASRTQVKLFGADKNSRWGNDQEQIKTFCVQNKVAWFEATQDNKTGKETAALGGRKTRNDASGTADLSNKAQLFMTVGRRLLDNDLYSGEVKLASKGQYSPVMRIRVDKQNRGTSGEFAQLYNGAYYQIIDVPEGMAITDDM